MCWAKLRTSCCLSLAKLTTVVELVEGDFRYGADLDVQLARQVDSGDPIKGGYFRSDSQFAGTLPAGPGVG